VERHSSFIKRAFTATHLLKVQASYGDDSTTAIIAFGDSVVRNISYTKDCVARVNLVLSALLLTLLLVSPEIAGCHHIGGDN
jgi:hypothetical protein